VRIGPPAICGFLLDLDIIEYMSSTEGYPVVDIPASLGRSQRAALQFLVEQLATAGLVGAGHIDAVVEKILQREGLGSTGIGMGVAIPHTTSPLLQQVVGIIGRSAAGIAWNSLDDRPAHFIVLILAPVDRPGDYIRALEQVARSLRKQSGLGPD